MHYVRRLFVLLMGVGLLMGLTTSLAFAQDPENGKVLWEEEIWQCMRCHGLNGEGVFGRPLAGSDRTVEEWITQVRTPARRMPSFSAEQISDEQIADIHAYLTSLPEPAEFGFRQIELAPDAHPGQVLIVEKRCVACHDVTGPINGFIQRGELPTAEAVITQLRNPRANMPTFDANHVSDEEAATIADFLASQVSEQIAQEAPEVMPVSGAAENALLLWVIVLVGVSLLSGGVFLRQITGRS